MDVALRRRDLRQARHAARQPVDIGHRKIDPRLERPGDRVEHRVRRSPLRVVEANRIFERLKIRVMARQNPLVAPFILPAPLFDDDPPTPEDPPSDPQTHMRTSYPSSVLKKKK